MGCVPLAAFLPEIRGLRETRPQGAAAPGVQAALLHPGGMVPVQGIRAGLKGLVTARAAPWHGQGRIWPKIVLGEPPV